MSELLEFLGGCLICYWAGLIYFHVLAWAFSEFAHTGDFGVIPTVFCGVCWILTVAILWDLGKHIVTDVKKYRERNA